MKRVHVCAQPGCPNLTPCPVEGHTRPRNAPWSTDRDRKAQRHFRRMVLARDGYACTRCVEPRELEPHELVAHHIRDGYDMADGITLCRDCHREVDPNAR